MNSTLTVRKSVGSNYIEMEIQGNNILLPLIFGIAIGILLKK